MRAPTTASAIQRSLCVTEAITPQSTRCRTPNSEKLAHHALRLRREIPIRASTGSGRGQTRSSSSVSISACRVPRSCRTRPISNAVEVFPVPDAPQITRTWISDSATSILCRGFRLKSGVRGHPETLRLLFRPTYGCDHLNGPRRDHPNWPHLASSIGGVHRLNSGGLEPGAHGDEVEGGAVRGHPQGTSREGRPLRP